MGEARISYTIQRDRGRRYYRGAIRRRRDDAVIWECGDEHATITRPFDGSALACALRKLRGQEAADTARPGEGA